MTEETSEKPNVYTGKLRSDIELFKGGSDSNNNPSWVIFDPVSDAYFRISDSDREIISALSDNCELEKFISKLREKGCPADKQKVLKVLAFLHSSNLMAPVYGKTEQNAAKIRDMKRKMRWQMFLSSYLFFRLPLLKPDRFLSESMEQVRAIFNRWTMTLLGVIALAGYVCLVVKWHKFTDIFINSISLQGLARYSIAVALIKIVHEFAHAYAAKSLGIRVRRMGVAFIVFFPRLYTDLTDSWRIPSRRKRFLIDGSGILSEILIGGGAALVWANTVSGITNTVAYYIFAVSIINTVLVNGNPFIRYDGYYLLMDLVNIDNMQKRGIERVRFIWRKYLFGINYQPDDDTTGWKKHFLVAYGISAFVYRIFLYTSIIMIVYFKFTKVVGIVLLLLEVYLLVAKPLFNEIKVIMTVRKKIKRRNFLLSTVGLTAILLVLALPLPWSAGLPCEVKPADSDMVYAKISGYLEKLPVADGQRVTSGDLLLLQQNPYISWRLKEAILAATIDRLQVDRAQSSTESLGMVKVNQEALRDSQALIGELKRKQQLLKTHSAINGIFALYDRRLRPGKWLSKGEIIGEVYAPKSNRIIAYLEEEDIKKVRLQDNVKISLHDMLDSVSGKIVQINQVPARFTPSPLLNVFGGPILCYMTAPGEFAPLKPYFQIVIKVTGDNPLPAGRTGTAWVHKYSSIGGNIIRNILNVLQRELSF